MKSLKNRLILSYFGLTLLTLLTLGGLFFFMVNRYSQQAESALSEEVRQRALGQVYEFMQESPDIGELRIFIDSIERAQGVDIQLSDGEGEDVFSQYTDSAIFTISSDDELSQMLNMMGQQGMRSNPRGPGIQWQFFFGKSDHEDLAGLLSDGLIDFSIAGSVQTGELTVHPPAGDRLSYFNPIGIIFLIAAGFVLLISGILGWRIGDSLTRPLRDLTGVVNRMSEGDLDARVETSLKDEELSQLAEQINTMAGELQGTITSLQQERDIMQRFLMDASHELRTPVTALSAYLELLSGKAGYDPDRRNEYIEMCISQNDRSRDIIVNLLDLLRIEQFEGKEQKHLESISVPELTDQVVSMISPIAEAKGIGISETGSLPEDASIIGDKFQLTTALKNVLENSIKYSPAQSHISLASDITGGDVRFTITDEGPGIPEEDLERVYDRFFRSTKATGTGSGLGLSMVKRIIENHGGHIEITNRTESPGLQAVISLPLAEA